MPKSHAAVAPMAMGAPSPAMSPGRLPGSIDSQAARTSSSRVPLDAERLRLGRREESPLGRGDVVDGSYCFNQFHACIVANSATMQANILRMRVAIRRYSGLSKLREPIFAFLYSRLLTWANAIDEGLN